MTDVVNARRASDASLVGRTPATPSHQYGWTDLIADIIPSLHSATAKFESQRNKSPSSTNSPYLIEAVMSMDFTTTANRGTCAVAVMAKASAPGRTKTRLSPPLTFAEAAALNTAFLQDIAAKLKRLEREASVVPYIAYGPPSSQPFFRSILPVGFELIEVWRPNFGECLLLATTSMLEAGHGSACVLNSDSPTLPAAYLIEAAQRLAQPGDRAVLGPSTDGGYYLLGLKQAHSRMFADIAWSTERVAEQTRERAREIGLELHELPPWYDVDDADGLRTVIADLQLGGAPAAANEAASRADATAELLLRLDREDGLFRRLGIDAVALKGASV